MRAAFRNLPKLKRILVCGVLLALVPATAQGKIEVLGAFSGVKHAHGDAFGYAVRLWKEGDQIFGLFLVYTGAPYDPPTGILEDVKFDPRTGRLSFFTRASTGLTYSQEHRGVPARDRFKFEGVLTRRQLRGNLSHTNELFPDKPATSKRIRLRWSAFQTDVMRPPPQTYSAWKTSVDEILRRRGPKW